MNSILDIRAISCNGENSGHVLDGDQSASAKLRGATDGGDKSVSGAVAALAPIPRVLHFVLVEDNPLDVQLLQRELRKANLSFTYVTVESEGDFTREVREHCPDMVLADYNLPQWGGMEALEVLKRERPDVPLILVTGALGEMKAVECLKSGVTDYILKGSLARLPVAIRTALQNKELQDRRQEAERKQQEYLVELKRSNEELEQFAYVASHDLQEPLRMVASYTELLAERYRGKLDPQADKFIGYAVDGATRMQRLIRDLLAFARVSSRAKPLQPTNSEEVLARVLNDLRPVMEKTGATVTHGKMPRVNADSLQLGQVLQNLIGNAIKFHGKTAPQVEVSAEFVDEMWKFVVADNGIGIANQVGDRIFQMFQRLHTRDEYEGTGIGLAIAKRIVERHGGRIWFDSRPGEGTTFQFTLPKADEVNSEQEDSHPAG
jgi:signal transduction histidine kinase